MLIPYEIIQFTNKKYTVLKTFASNISLFKDIKKIPYYNARMHSQVLKYVSDKTC